jgi:polyhydroxyalkanoate synthesis regulator phasin
MADNDFRRYLDAGMAFTQLTRARAQAIVKDLVKAGEVQRDQAQERVEELLERSRKNTEMLLDVVRKEVRQQLSSMGLATKEDIARLERKIGAGGAKKSSGAKKAAPKKATAAKSGAGASEASTA